MIETVERRESNYTGKHRHTGYEHIHRDESNVIEIGSSWTCVSPAIGRTQIRWRQTTVQAQATSTPRRTSKYPPPLTSRTVCSSVHPPCCCCLCVCAIVSASCQGRLVPSSRRPHPELTRRVCRTASTPVDIDRTERRCRKPVAIDEAGWQGWCFLDYTNTYRSDLCASEPKRATNSGSFSASSPSIGSDAAAVRASRTESMCTTFRLVEVMCLYDSGSGAHRVRHRSIAAEEHGLERASEMGWGRRFSFLRLGRYNRVDRDGGAV